MMKLLNNLIYLALGMGLMASKLHGYNVLFTWLFLGITVVLAINFANWLASDSDR
ncbi:hypothetical protein [uncultured Limosilactobacillus sp.]|uniref:hypothetical protein n=1 Tax=uncultured Limosilactobacillus sp. TaxID=2837629 RepID=UPI0025F2D9C1|nr:hypothetical protein [uncultured Limosilactobacillus sp.]